MNSSVCWGSGDIVSQIPIEQVFDGSRVTRDAYAVIRKPLDLRGITQLHCPTRLMKGYDARNFSIRMPGDPDVGCDLIACFDTWDEAGSFAHDLEESDALFAE